MTKEDCYRHSIATDIVRLYKGISLEIFPSALVTQSKSKTTITISGHSKFNCNTVEYNGTRHGIYVQELNIVGGAISLIRQLPI